MTNEVQWRRRWKPDLKAKEWQSFTIIGKPPLLIKCMCQENVETGHFYEILVTDLQSTWYEKLEEDSIATRNKRLNPVVEAPVSKLLDVISENIQEQKATTVYNLNYKRLQYDGNEDEEDSPYKLLLSFTAQLAGLPFTWKFSALPASKSMISEQLTCPLYTMVCEMTRRQSELVKLIRNKDKEIEDYKAQGVRVSRKHLETATFDETLFVNNMDTSKGFEQQVTESGKQHFGKSCQDLYRQVMTKHAWLTRSTTEELEGESLLPEETVGGTVGPTGQSWANRIPNSLAPSSANVSPTKSPARSPVKSPHKSPAKPATPATTPVKDTELQRRLELEQKLRDEEEKRELKAKKKKKIKL